MSERIYDEQIAPLLKQAAALCNQHGLSFTSMVEFESGKTGLTFNGPPDEKTTGAAMFLAYYAVLARGNFDSLAFKLMKHASEHGHGSLILSRLGVKTSPAKAQGSAS